MFEIFYKTTLKKALKKTTAALKKKYPKSLSSGEPFFSNEEIQIITHIKLFENVERRYKNYYLSGYGGLGWFLSKFIGEVIDKIETNRDLTTNIHLTAYKLSFYAIILAELRPLLTLERADTKQIMDAELYAKKYFELTNKEILNDLEGD